MYDLIHFCIFEQVLFSGPIIGWEEENNGADKET